MRQRGVRLGAAASFGIFLAVALFALMALLTVVLGAGVYRSVVARADDSGNLRTSLIYVSGKLRSLGEGGEISLEKTSVGSDVLVLSEEIEGERYETRIYTYGGRLYEVFAAQGERFEPDEGQAIADLDALEIDLKDSGLVYLTAVVNGSECAVHVAPRR